VKMNKRFIRKTCLHGIRLSASCMFYRWNIVGNVKPNFSVMCCFIRLSRSLFWFYCITLCRSILCRHSLQSKSKPFEDSYLNLKELEFIFELKVDPQLLRLTNFNKTIGCIS